MGPLPETTNGNSYVLVVGDYFTRLMEAYPIRNQEAVTVAQKLVDEFFCRFSTPEQLHSDQGGAGVFLVAQLVQARQKFFTSFHWPGQ